MKIKIISIKKNIIFLIFCVLLTQSLGCVRYIPKRLDLNQEKGFDPAAEYVGKEAFYLYDQEQRNRLQNLINKRLRSSPEAWDNVYRIGPGDTIKIDVKNFEEVSKEYTVLPNGNIQLPFMGTIKVKGLSESALTNKIKSKVTNFIVNPLVYTEVTNYESQKVWVLGQNSSGNGRRDGGSGGSRGGSSRTFPLKKLNTSLVELLIEIADPKILSSKGVIYLYPSGALDANNLNSRTSVKTERRTELIDTNPYCYLNNSTWLSKNLDIDANESLKIENQQPASCKGSKYLSQSLASKYHPNSRIQIDVEELFGGISNPPLYVPLKAGDAIYFPPPSIVQVYGEVRERGTFQVIGGGNSSSNSSSGGIKPSLFSVLSAARGLTYSADINNIEIYRELEYGKKVVLSVDFQELTLRNTQDVRLRDGDIVWVPSKSGRFTEEHSINAINQFIGTGNNFDNSVIQR